MVLECVFCGHIVGALLGKKGPRGKWAEWNLGRNGEEIRQEQSVYETTRNKMS